MLDKYLQTEDPIPHVDLSNKDLTQVREHRQKMHCAKPYQISGNHLYEMQDSRLKKIIRT